MSINEDLYRTFAVCRRFLRLVGAWPDPDVPLSDFRRPKIRIMISVCIVCIYVYVPQLSNAIHSWGNVNLMIQHIASANYSFLACCKLIVTRYHGETLRTLMTSLKTDWVTSKRNWERNTMLKVARTGRNISFSCYMSFICVAIFYVYFNLLKFYRNICLSERKLVYQFDYPYDMQKVPYYVITYFIQICAGICAAFINSTVDTFVSLLLLHVCAQLINLRTTLNNLVEKLAEKSIPSAKYKEGITAIVLRHESLIRNAKIIDNCYSLVLLVHMIATTFQLCFQTFQVYTKITDENSDGLTIGMVYLMFYVMFVLTHIYIYCYSAEKLLSESIAVAYGVYECKWYDIPSRDAKDLMFIVCRSIIPLRLTAGKFSTFSIETFGMTVKTSMGYLSMLLAINN
ncbi:odorant receptor 13a-like [Harpegnathos saltator]|uniref:odorant receptor 13a-like n=1 Tax=Harpegnathos saltator TaxID=610380 RepID=UPI000948C900|nr:odorant receptor 13a-like [Harpegnathos saltator]